MSYRTLTYLRRSLARAKQKVAALEEVLSMYEVSGPGMNPYKEGTHAYRAFNEIAKAGRPLSIQELCDKTGCDAEGSLESALGRGVTQGVLVRTAPATYDLAPVGDEAENERRRSLCL